VHEPDPEKSALASVTPSEQASDEDLRPAWTQRLLKWGVETRGKPNFILISIHFHISTGIRPVPVEERTDDSYSKIFTLWFTVNFNVLSYVFFVTLYPILTWIIYCSVFRLAFWVQRYTSLVSEIARWLSYSSTYYRVFLLHTCLYPSTLSFFPV